MKTLASLIAAVLGVDARTPSITARVAARLRSYGSRMACACQRAFARVRRRPAAVETATAARRIGSSRRADRVKLRAIFISDLHLGAKGAQAGMALDFLQRHEAETIYLVGDVIDGWKLASNWYWPDEHDAVIRHLVARARLGERVVYLPGNHDEFMRDFYGTPFAGVEVVEELIHQGLDGRRHLVMHGDRFDVVVAHARWLALLGDWAYFLVLGLNRHVNRVRRFFGLTYWSLSAWAKMKVKNAVNFIGAFEATLAQEARRQGADGVICGHIHHAAQRDLDGVAYMNCGDWVESCTALVETLDGRFEILRWTGVSETAEEAGEFRRAAA